MSINRLYRLYRAFEDRRGRLPIDRWVEEDHDEVAALAEEEPVVNEENRRAVVALLRAGSRTCGGHGFREL